MKELRLIMDQRSAECQSICVCVSVCKQWPKKTATGNSLPTKFPS